ncbi:hypothetical protein AB0I95_21745 [Micromonospora sp. NPDC049751]|uniref:hypothetical protein n=1 Tax=Micromonospora sp. NPDC049751 TaxID=3154837 RepID=UPI0034098E32
MAVVAIMAVRPWRIRVFQAVGLAMQPARPTYRPLRGRMAAYAAEAYQKIAARHTVRADNSLLVDAADLWAVFRLIREVVSAQYTERWVMQQIDEQVRVSVDDPPVFLHRTRALLDQVQPRTDDIAQAIAVLHYVVNSEMYGATPVVVAATTRYYLEHGQGASFTYRPLGGRLARLSAEAYPQIANRVKPDTDDKREAVGYAADLVAVVRFYREVVSNALTDNMFDALLSDNPIAFLNSLPAKYEQVNPRTPDLDQAIVVVREFSRSSLADAYVALAREALGR